MQKARLKPSGSAIWPLPQLQVKRDCDSTGFTYQLRPSHSSGLDLRCETKSAEAHQPRISTVCRQFTQTAVGPNVCRRVFLDIEKH
jgi:hypothetical protein